MPVALRVNKLHRKDLQIVVIETDIYFNMRMLTGGSSFLILMANRFFLNDAVKGFNTYTLVAVVFSAHTRSDAVNPQ